MSRRTHITVDNTIELRRQRRRSHAPWATAPHRAEDRLATQLAVVRPVAKTALTPGTVVWAHIPYEETDGWKLRPAVVSHASGRNVVVFPGTTASSRFRYPWARREVTDLESAGLRRATGIHLEPIILDVIDIVSVGGRLGSEDQLAVLRDTAAAA